MSKAKSKPVVFAVAIGGDAYEISPLEAAPDIARRAFRFRKLAGDQAVYDIRFTQYGPECDCRGYLFHRHCKHCDALVTASRIFNLV